MKTNDVLAEEVSKKPLLFPSPFSLNVVHIMTSVFFLYQIQERDEGALKYLKDIKWCRIDNPKGFKLDFFFDTNPYFKNSVLTKTYHMIDEDEPILEKAIG